MNMIKSEDLNDKIKGMVYGFALGDAWGYKTEFKRFDQIMKAQTPIPNELIISDDTQMSLYNIKAVEELFNNFSIDELNSVVTDVSLQNTIRKIFADQHVLFFKDKRNDRAPGKTCMKALDKYSRTKIRVQGNEGSWGNNSKGCGTIMRAPWLGILPINRDAIAVLAILQSETTHGHPTASISSAIAAMVMHDLFYETKNLLGNDEAFKIAFSALEELKEINTPLIKNSEIGIEEVEKTLINAVDKWGNFFHSKDDYDINNFFGEGWIAEEALANALASVSFYSPSYLNNSLSGVKRLVYTNGDSDSIAAIGGAMLGIYNGYNSFDYPIAENIEEYYKNELIDTINFLERIIKDDGDVY